MSMIIKIFISRLVRVCIFLAISFPTHAFEPWVISRTNVTLGNTMPGPGTCEIDLDTEALSGALCVDSLGSVGEYELHANPNTDVQIVVDSINDSGDGIIFAAEGRYSTDLDSDIAFVGGVSQTINSGSSGVIYIYVAGRLTLSQSISLDTVYSPEFDITYNEL